MSVSVRPSPEPEAEPSPETWPKWPMPEPERNMSLVMVPEPRDYPGHNAGSPLPEGEVWPEGEFWPEPEGPPERNVYMPVLAVIAGVLGTIIVVENCIVLFAILRGKPKHPPIISYLIVNLSIADALAGLQLIWFTCFDQFIDFPRTGVYIMVMCGIWLLTISTSVLGLAGFAWHRLLVVRRSGGVSVSKTKAVVFLTMCWLASTLLFLVPPVAGWNCVYCTESCHAMCSQILFPFTKAYVTMMGALLLLAVIFLYVSYIWIFVTVRNRMKRVNKSNILHRERSMVITVIILLSVFTICNFPLVVLFFVDHATNTHDPRLIQSFQIMTVLSFVSAACNPMLYTWRLLSVRDAAWRAFGKHERVSDYSVVMKGISHEESGARKTAQASKVTSNPGA